MKPQFKNIDIKSAGFAQTCPVEWASKQDNSSVWRTAEQILVKPVYTAHDLEGMEHLDYASGIPPYRAVLTAVCTLCVLGRSVSMQASLRLRSLTPSIAVTSPLVRRVFPLPLTLLPTVGTTLTILV